MDGRRKEEKREGEEKGENVVRIEKGLDGRRKENGREKEMEWTEG